MESPNEQLLDRLLDEALSAANEELRERHRSVSVDVFAQPLARLFVKNREIYLGEPTMHFQVFARMIKARAIGVYLAKEMAP